MTNERHIYTAAEARSLREAATHGPYERDGLYVRTSPHDAPLAQVSDDYREARATATLFAAAPALTHSVDHWHGEHGLRVRDLAESETERHRGIDRETRLARERDDCRADYDALEDAAAAVVRAHADDPDSPPWGVSRRIGELRDSGFGEWWQKTTATRVPPSHALRAEVERLAADNDRLRAAVRELVAAEDDATRHEATADRHLRYHAAWDALRALAAEVSK